MKKKKPYDYTDEELVKGSLERDRFLQEMLYRKYADAMYNISLRYAKDVDEAADILQEGFIKVYAKLEQHDKDKSLGAWIKKIIINTAITKVKKVAAERDRLIQYSNERIVDDQNEDIKSERSIELKKKIECLPNKAQLVLKLYFLEGLAHKEIADLLKISVGTSKSQLSYAKKILQQNLKEA